MRRFSKQRRLHLIWALGVSAVLMAACSASPGSQDPLGERSPVTVVPGEVDDAASRRDTSSQSVASVPASPAASGPSALSAALGEEVDGLPAAIVPLTDLRAGGPPPDGIPPIDEPRFVNARSVDYLADREPVLAVNVNGEDRAYPVQILIWHEIVNDTIAGVPVAVTYCPLCNSAVAYDRRLGDRVLSFGTSGLLWRSALVMYDRQTESLWSHYTGEAIAGQLTGAELDNFPVSTVPWGLWRDRHPDALVLSRDTGFERSYGANPYPGYDDVDGTPFLFEGEVDGTFTAMTRIVGIEGGGEAIGVPLELVRDERVVGVVIGDRPTTVWWTPGVTSALDAVEIAQGDDVGVTGVFVSEVDGLELSFSATADGFTDTETDTLWNALGEAVSGPLAGRRLTSVAHVDTFWFAWSTFRPDARTVSR